MQHFLTTTLFPKEKSQMGNFLVQVEYDPGTNNYYAQFADGDTVNLNASNYQDAVIEADHINPANYELGYN